MLHLQKSIHIYINMLKVHMKFNEKHHSAMKTSLIKFQVATLFSNK